MSPSVESTIELIKVLHAGRIDLTGSPYWMHPVTVMRLLPDCATDAERMAALLHDVLEDTPTTTADLLALGYDPEVVEMVELVSRTPDKGTYIEWVCSIAASANRGAIRVKIADILHNSNPDRLAAIPDPEQRDRMQVMAEGRYAKATRILSAALANL